MLTGVDPPLDGAVVLLEHIIQIWHRPMPTILGQIACAFELRNGGQIRGVAIGVDHPRRGMVHSAQHFCEKALSTSGSNCRHLNRPQTEEARMSIRPAYHGLPAKLQHFRPEHVAWSTEIRAVPFKKTRKSSLTYLDKPEIDALLKAPDLRTAQGNRDYCSSTTPVRAWRKLRT